MVHCRVASPYLSPTYPTEGDYSGRSGGYCDVPWRLHLGGGETSIGLVQVQSQLANLMMQLQDMEKEKVVCEHVWCTMCQVRGAS
jgi:hypothetical protein